MRPKHRQRFLRQREQADRQHSYLDLVILSDGHGADVVLLPQLLGEWGGHYFSSNVGRCIEVPLAVLAAV